MNQHTGTECNNCFYIALIIEKCRCGYVFFGGGFLYICSRLNPNTTLVSQRPRQHAQHRPPQMGTHSPTCALQRLSSNFVTTQAPGGPGLKVHAKWLKCSFKNPRVMPSEFALILKGQKIRSRQGQREGVSRSSGRFFLPWLRQITWKISVFDTFNTGNMNNIHNYTENMSTKK